MMQIFLPKCAAAWSMPMTDEKTRKYLYYIYVRRHSATMFFQFRVEEVAHSLQVKLLKTRACQTQ
jgi:hypothetical protein